jgi:hypothetical protein
MCVCVVSSATLTEASLYTLRQAPDGLHDLDEFVVRALDVLWLAFWAAAGPAMTAIVNRAGMSFVCTK